MTDRDFVPELPETMDVTRRKAHTLDIEREWEGVRCAVDAICQWGGGGVGGERGSNIAAEGQAREKRRTTIPRCQCARLRPHDFLLGRIDNIAVVPERLTEV